jgi:hypothetical protein
LIVLKAFIRSGSSIIMMSVEQIETNSNASTYKANKSSDSASTRFQYPPPTPQTRNSTHTYSPSPPAQTRHTSGRTPYDYRQTTGADVLSDCSRKVDTLVLGSQSCGWRRDLRCQSPNVEESICLGTHLV